jgi:hypothetical protein
MEQPQPKNYLVEAILITIFCCQPFGIVGIVFSSQVNSKYAAGDYNGALQASKDAKKWTKWGFITGLVAGTLFLLIYGAIIFFAYQSGEFNDF